MKIKNNINPTFGLAGVGIGLGLVADNFSSSPEIVSGLYKAGEFSTSFISPAISVMAGGYIVNQLKNLNPKNGGCNGIQSKSRKTHLKI